MPKKWWRVAPAALVLSCTVAAADPPATKGDAVDHDDPRVAFVWDYLCAGRPPFLNEHKVRQCACPDRKTGAPGKEAPSADGAVVGDIYLGSFTRPRAEQAVVTLFDCVSFERTTLLLMEKQKGRWVKAAYSALSQEEEDEHPTRDSLPSPPLNNGLGGHCMTWLDGGLTRFVCEGGAALFVNTKKGSTLYGVGVVYDVSVDESGAQASGDPLLRFVDNTHSDCDLMPLRHRVDLTDWSVDTRGRAPRLTLRLDLADGRATQHGDTKACYEDVPATRHVDLRFDWKDGAWRPDAASAAAIAALEKIAAEFDRM